MKKFLIWQITAAVTLIGIGGVGLYTMATEWEDPTDDKVASFHEGTTGQTTVPISLAEIEEFRDAIRLGTRVVGLLLWIILGAGVLMAVSAYLLTEHPKKSERAAARRDMLTARTESQTPPRSTE